MFTLFSLGGEIIQHSPVLSDFGSSVGSLLGSETNKEGCRESQWQATFAFHVPRKPLAGVAISWLQFDDNTYISFVLLIVLLMPWALEDQKDQDYFP